MDANLIWPLLLGGAFLFLMIDLRRQENPDFDDQVDKATTSGLGVIGAVVLVAILLAVVLSTQGVDVVKLANP